MSDRPRLMAAVYGALVGLAIAGVAWNSKDHFYYEWTGHLPASAMPTKRWEGSATVKGDDLANYLAQHIGDEVLLVVDGQGSRGPLVYVSQTPAGSGTGGIVIQEVGRRHRVVRAEAVSIVEVAAPQKPWSPEEARRRAEAVKQAEQSSTSEAKASDPAVPAPIK